MQVWTMLDAEEARHDKEDEQRQHDDSEQLHPSWCPAIAGDARVRAVLVGLVLSRQI